MQAFGPGNKALTTAISISGFTGGDYVVFDVSGNVTFHFAHVSGGSAVVDALFLDPTPTPTPTSVTPTPKPTPTPL